MAIAEDINNLVAICHSLSYQAGWWHHNKTGMNLVAVVNNPKNDLESLLGSALVTQKLCLMHSEISEAMEGHRKGAMDDKLPHRPMIEVEIADLIIRACDLAGAMKLDVGGAVKEKLEFNMNRKDHKQSSRENAGGKAY